MRGRLTHEGGFGLVEVLIAGFILVVGIGAGAYAFVTSQKGSMTAERNATATAVASRTLEKVRAMPYADVGTDLSGVTQPLEQDGEVVLNNNLLTTRDGKSEGVVRGALPALFNVSVAEGGRTVTYQVYRFVSWRDEECELMSTVDLKGLRDDVMNIKADLDKLANDGNTLENLYNELDPGTLQDQTGYIRTTIHRLHNDATAIVDAIQALDGQPDGVVSERLDLCDVPPGTPMPDLSGVAAARTLLATLNTHLDELDTEAQGLIDILLGVVTCLLTDCQQPYKDAMRQAYATIMGYTDPADPEAPSSTDVVDNEIESVLGTLTTEISRLKDLALLPDTKENTKRVTVGVVNPLERDGTGPRKVVWKTTVLNDPEVGLL